MKFVIYQNLQQNDTLVKSAIINIDQLLQNLEFQRMPANQVIPGNLQKYVSTNHSILWCKTLPAHFSNNMMVYCLLNVI